MPKGFWTSLGQWRGVLLLAGIGACAFELILALAWLRVSAITTPFSPVFLAVVVWLATALLVCVVGEPIRLRRHQWWKLYRYPPTWLAVPLALGIAALADRLPCLARPIPAGPDWRETGVVVFALSAVAAGVLFRQLPGRKPRQATLGPSRVSGRPLSWEELQPWLAAGERPLHGGEHDLFEHRRLAARVARAIAAERRNVALLGRFGSGKSSILNLVSMELARLPELFVVVNLDVWAVPEPSDVPRFLRLKSEDSPLRVQAAKS
jgi:hypothetical protein